MVRNHASLSPWCVYRTALTACALHHSPTSHPHLSSSPLPLTACALHLHRRPTGALYGGEWQADLRHGQGHFQDADGTTWTGMWQHGKFDGPGVMHRVDGRRYGHSFPWVLPPRRDAAGPQSASFSALLMAFFCV